MSGARARLSPLASHALIYAAFFASGASSLVFQAIWSRLLQHVLGSSSLAISSVVSVFMAGLGVGAYWVGKRADRIRRPLLMYALAELGIGLASLAVPLLLQPDGFLATANAALRSELGASSTWFFVARFACIVPVLIVPTFLMGATLPLLSRHAVAQASSSAQASTRVGQLYAVNTLGAVLGVLASSFVLMPRVGVHATNAIAAGANFVLSGCVLVALRWLPLGGSSLGANPAEAHTLQGTTAASAPLSVRRAAVIAFGLSGFSSLLSEVVWSRALVSTIGGSLYSFSLIVATFLLGIALGSALSSWFAQERTRALAVVVACVSSGVAALPMLAGARPRMAVVLAGGALVVIALLSWLRRKGVQRESWMPLGDATDAYAQSSRPARSLGLEMLVPPGVAAITCVLEPSRLSVLTAVVVANVTLLSWLLAALASRPLWLLAALQAFIAAATFASDLAVDELALTFASMVLPLYEVLPDHVTAVQALMCATAGLCVLPSALGMGAVFPVALRVWSDGGQRIGQDVGVLYMGNTLGSIAGAWLPGFVLMPLLGLQATLHVGIATSLCVALGLVWLTRRHELGTRSDEASATTERRARRVLLFALPGALAALAVCSAHPSAAVAWDISKMTLGAFRLSLAREVLDEEAWGAPDVVFHRDGLSTTVTVERWGRHYSLKNNGKVDASNGDDMPTQILVAALPLLMHPRGPSGLDVSVVGFGSGVTVGAALQFPLRSLEVVELEAATVEASRHFAGANHLHYTSRRFPYVSEPRLSVIHDDGRNHLAATRKRYDVIVSEPSNPWLTGVADLFTLDHFRVAKRRLKPQGVYCQWVQLYEISPENVKSLYRTFATSFAHVIAFSPGNMSSDTILVGSDEPLTLDLPRVRAAMTDAALARELQRAGVRSPFEVFSRVLFSDRRRVLAFAGAAPLNTDDNARVELSAPRDLIGFRRFRGYLRSFFAERWPYARVTDVLRGFGEGVQASRAYAQQALALLAQGRKTQARAAIELARAAGASAELSRAEAVYSGLVDDAERPALVFPAAEQAISRDASPAARDALTRAYALSVPALQSGDLRRALSGLQAAPRSLRRAEGGIWDQLEGVMLHESGEHEAAIDLLAPLVERTPQFAQAHPETLYFLARAEDSAARFAPAVRNFLSYVQAREQAREFTMEPALSAPSGR